MATAIDVTKAEGIIAHTFNDKDMASLALTAPGAVVPGAVHSPDGNRGLALLGISVLETIALTHWHASGGDRSLAQQTVSRVTGGSFLADIAQQTGLDVCIAVNNSQQGVVPSPTLLKSTVAALIGAVWRDSNRSYTVVEAVMTHLQ
ncbi:MAG: hypothetical protein OHK93_004891 [Ramalina farinacea]|uniref:RNase III domain-containing protein n=1 Tax=Ramalina farinacea TaxID=258253 RepID=A0AA43QWR8_9LECA|nr:hypothetical protein [Ramalina farinacea]